MIFDAISFAILSPVLVVQGLYVKKKTPELPEPEGARNRVVGRGRELRVLIIGDSAAAGVGVEHQDDALLGSLSGALSSYFQVDLSVFATTGFCTSKSLEDLGQRDGFEVDVVVSSLGVNDVTSLSSRSKFDRSQRELYALLMDKFSAKKIIVNSVPPMHQFPALPQPLRWVLGKKAKSLNSSLKKLALDRPELEFLNLEFPVNEQFFASDGFHPSKMAYKYWAEELANLIQNLEF